jgi:hypothetical protein
VSARLALALALAALSACSDPPATTVDAGGPLGDSAAPERCAGGVSRGTVITRLVFARERMGVSEGFDLDGRDTPMGDMPSCFRPDYVSPEGVRGVDNQLSQLAALLDLQTQGAVDGLIQAAVNNGQLLMAITLEGVDDEREDPCVDMIFQRVQGVPTVGSDGVLDPWQSYDPIPDTPVTRARATIRGGVLEAGPFEGSVAVAVLDARFVLDLHGARLRARLGKDGALTGVLGGGMSVAQLSEIVGTLTIPMEFMNLARSYLRTIADLDRRDGRCQQFSAALSITGRAAFVNR